MKTFIQWVETLDLKNLAGRVQAAAKTAAAGGSQGASQVVKRELDKAMTNVQRDMQDDPESGIEDLATLTNQVDKVTGRVSARDMARNPNAAMKANKNKGMKK